MSNLCTAESYTGPIEAHLARGRLEAEGIPAFVIHEHHIWANWTLSQALGGIKLQVPVAELERARLVLDHHREGRYAQPLDELFADLPRDVCARCGSAQLATRFRIGPLLLVFATLFTLSIIFPVRRDRHRCVACGHAWAR
jgi:hypothetical protein